MTYEFIGKVIATFERPYASKQTGEQKMQWEVVIEHENNNPNYPSRKVVVSVWDANVFNAISMCYGNGMPVKATCSIDAREYNGRWFNDIKCFRAEPYQQQQMGGYPQQPMQQQDYQQPQGFQAPAVPQQPPFQQGSGNANQHAGGQVQGQGNPYDGQIPF